MNIISKKIGETLQEIVALLPDDEEKDPKSPTMVEALSLVCQGIEEEITEEKCLEELKKIKSNLNNE